MADISGVSGDSVGSALRPDAPLAPFSREEARAVARERFKTKLINGEQIGNCACHDDTEADADLDATGAPAAKTVGVRFRDSGRVYYFAANGETLAAGDWVVVETARGREAGRIVIAPHQVRLNQLQGELRPILRRLDDADVERMDALKRDAARAVKVFGAKIRERGLPMKPISAEYSFDGSHLTLHFSAPDRVDFRDLVRDLGGTFRCRVELRQVGPRDEARLLGGVGRCGRTLCCSSWLPVFPDISMNMVKTQDLPLNPSKVSGVCGRLLFCLSYENEQYRQMKMVMPRLGQTIETPSGTGMVISLQVLKELVTVRLAADNSEVVFSSVDLGLRKPEAAPEPVTAAVDEPSSASEPAAVEGNQADGEERRGGSRRRGRRRGRGGGAIA